MSNKGILTLQQALDKATPSLRRKMEYSVELLRKAEKLALMYDSENGFWLGFSGGKDSQALYHMAQLAGVRFKGFFSPTSVDPPEVIRFIRRNYPDITFTSLKRSIYQEFISRKCLPSMKIRWCCAQFKEQGGENKVVLVGVRHAESMKRSKRKEVEVTGHKFSGDIEAFNEWSEQRRAKLQRIAKNKAKKDKQFDQFTEHKEQMVTCINGKDKIVVSPIIDWSEDDVWEFLNKVVEVPHCELYDKGRHRIGCICCPMASIKNTLRDIREYPYVKEKWIQAIMAVRREGLTQITPPNLLIASKLPPSKPNIYQHPKLGLQIPTSNSTTDRSGLGHFLGGTSISHPSNKSKRGAEQNQLQRPLLGIWNGVFGWC